MDFDVRHQPQMHWDGRAFLDFKQELDLGHHPGLPPVNKPARWKKSSRRGRHSTVQGFERLNVRKTRLENEEKTWLINSLPWSYAEAVRNPNKKQPKQQYTKDCSNEEANNGSCQPERENVLKETIICTKEINSNDSGGDVDSPLNPDANEFIPGVSSDKNDSSSSDQDDLSSCDKDELSSPESQTDPEDEKTDVQDIQSNKTNPHKDLDDVPASPNEITNLISEGRSKKEIEDNENGVKNDQLLDLSVENALECENNVIENNLINSDSDLIGLVIKNIDPANSEKNISENHFEKPIVCSDQTNKPNLLDASMTNEVINDNFKCHRVSFINTLDFDEIVKDKNQYSENNFKNIEEPIEENNLLANNESEFEDDDDRKNEIVETTEDQVNEDCNTGEQTSDCVSNNVDEESSCKDNKKNERLEIVTLEENIELKEVHEQLQPEEILESGFILYEYSRCSNEDVSEEDETEMENTEYVVEQENHRTNDQNQVISDTQTSEIKNEEISLNPENDQNSDEGEQNFSNIQFRKLEQRNNKYNCALEMNKTSTANSDNFQEDNEVITDEILMDETNTQNAESKNNEDDEPARSQIDQEEIEYLDNHQESTENYKLENHTIISATEDNHGHPEHIENECSDTHEDNTLTQTGNDSITFMSEQDLAKSDIVKKQCAIVEYEVTSDSGEENQSVQADKIDEKPSLDQIDENEIVTSIYEEDLTEKEMIEKQLAIAENEITSDSEEENKSEQTDKIDEKPSHAGNDITSICEEGLTVKEIVEKQLAIVENETASDSREENQLEQTYKIDETPSHTGNDITSICEEALTEKELVKKQLTIAENEITSDSAEDNQSDNEISAHTDKTEDIASHAGNDITSISEGDLTEKEMVEKRLLIAENEITSDSVIDNQSVNDMNTRITIETNVNHSDENTIDSNCGNISMNEHFFAMEADNSCKMYKDDKTSQEVQPQDDTNNEMTEYINPENGETQSQVINVSEDHEKTNENKENNVPLIVTSVYDEEFTSINLPTENSKLDELISSNIMVESHGSLDSSFEIINDSAESDDNVQTFMNEIKEDALVLSHDGPINEQSQNNEKPDIVHDVKKNIIEYNVTQGTETCGLQGDDTTQAKITILKEVITDIDKDSNEVKNDQSASTAPLMTATASVAAGALAVDSLINEKMDHASHREDQVEIQMPYKENEKMEASIKSPDVPSSPKSPKKSASEATKSPSKLTAGSKVPPKPSSPVTKPKMPTKSGKPDTQSAEKVKPVDKMAISGTKGSSPSNSLAKGIASTAKSTTGASKLTAVVGTAATLSVKPTAAQSKTPSSLTKTTTAKPTVPSPKPAGTTTAKTPNATKPTIPKPGSPIAKTANSIKAPTSKPASAVSKPTPPASKVTSSAGKPTPVTKPSATSSSTTTKPSTPPLKSTASNTKAGPASVRPSATGTKPGVPLVKATMPLTKPGTPPAKAATSQAKPGTPPTKTSALSSKPSTPPTKVAAPVAKSGTPTSATKYPANAEKLKTNKPTLKNVKPTSDKPTEVKTSSKPINKPSTPPTKAVSAKPASAIKVSLTAKKAETTKQSIVSTTSKPSQINGNSSEQKSNLVKTGDNTAVKTNNLKTAVKVPSKSANPAEKSKTAPANKPTSNKTESITKKTTTDKKAVADKNAKNLVKTTTKDTLKNADSKEQEVTSTTDDSQLEKGSASLIEDCSTQIIV